MQMLSEGNFSGVNKAIRDLKDRIDIVENSSNEKNKNLKSQIVRLEER